MQKGIKNLDKELKTMSLKQLENLRKIFIAEEEQDKNILEAIEQRIAKKTMFKRLAIVFKK